MLLVFQDVPVVLLVKLWSDGSKEDIIRANVERGLRTSLHLLSLGWLCAIRGILGNTFVVTVCSCCRGGRDCGLLLESWLYFPWSKDIVGQLSAVDMSASKYASLAITHPFV